MYRASSGKVCFTERFSCNKWAGLDQRIILHCQRYPGRQKGSSSIQDWKFIWPWNSDERAGVWETWLFSRDEEGSRMCARDHVTCESVSPRLVAGSRRCLRLLVSKSLQSEKDRDIREERSIETLDMRNERASLLDRSHSEEFSLGDRYSTISADFTSLSALKRLPFLRRVGVRSALSDKFH